MSFNSRQFCCILWIILIFIDLVTSFVDPFSTATVATVAASSALLMLSEYVGLSHFMCKAGVRECCTNAYIQPNMTRFKLDLSQNLYGQHIAQKTVYNAVKAHILNKNPQKPLVMSFHGWTGGGKNFVARMVVKSIYTKAEKSNYVHVFNSEVHFKHSNLVPLYKDQLQNWIRGNVSKCAQSIFIFDEMDHMPEGLVDALKPFLEPHPLVNGVDYRKSIFIFLSNTGGGPIVEHCLRVWDEGKSRDSITLSDMQEILMKSAFNQKSGLRSSGIIDRNLIDHFVPFLPLEREHIRQCIRDEINRNIKENSWIRLEKIRSNSLVTDILNELLWFPKGVNLYSKSGCKKIAQKVALVLSDHDEL